MKLITWNTQWCCGTDGVVSPERIVREARALADWDVLCLQEIASGFDGLPGQPGDQPAQLQALLPGYRVFFGAAVDELDASGKRQRFGNLIATRLPVLSVQHHPLPWPADPAVPGMPRMCSVVTLRAPGLGPLRVMTTHLAYHSGRQRLAQMRALRDLHREACALAVAPPLDDDENTPFRSRAHTRHAILCGDFNCAPDALEYATVQESFCPLALMHQGLEATDIESSQSSAPMGSPAPVGQGPGAAESGCVQWRDAWPLVWGHTPHAPTFRLYDRSHGPEPVACDFVFVSQSLTDRVRSVAVDGQTQASDHQPVWIELG